MFVNLNDEKFYIAVAQLVSSFHSTWFESQGSGETVYFDLRVVVEFVSSRYKMVLKTGHPYLVGIEVLTAMVMNLL
jgi:hypothetical protein